MLVNTPLVELEFALRQISQEPKSQELKQFTLDVWSKCDD